MIIHHSTKSGMKDKGALESVRGSGAIVGAVDNVINITKPLNTHAVAIQQWPMTNHLKGRFTSMAVSPVASILSTWNSAW